MLNNVEAYTLLKNYVHEDNNLKHAFAVEAIMKKVAQHLKENVELWGLVGLLHDIDYEYTRLKPQNHGLMSAKILDDLLPNEATYAIKAHNYIHTNTLPINPLDKALLASDALSGLIISTALIMPNKKIEEIKIESLIKKFKNSSFAKGCNRDQINLCNDLGIELKEFLKIGLIAIKEISDIIEIEKKH